jgi:hypothetical protein
LSNAIESRESWEEARVKVDNAIRESLEQRGL